MSTTTDATTARATGEDLDEFLGRVAGDASTTFHAVTVLLGDKLGLYKALAEHGPATAGELAAATGCDERYVREWLNAQTVAEYARHDADSERFWLTPAQAAVLADESSPAFAAGMMALAGSLFKDEERVVRDAFRTGGGVHWGEHHHDLFDATERLFKPGYETFLVPEWLPALEGVVDKLARGAHVADVGCGYGASTIVLARAFPSSTFVGLDTHGGSIDVARQRAADAGVADRVRFDVGSAGDLERGAYDLVAVFDALHDLGDPVGVSTQLRRALAADGTFLLVEPQAGETLAENTNVVGKLFYSAGIFVCLPNAIAQGGAQRLGNQVPDGTWRELLAQAGFTRFRRATETPFNRVFEVRP